MNQAEQEKAFLQLCLTKRLLDKAQATDIWQQARQSGQLPQVILVQQNLMAQHTVHALEKELRQTQEPRIIAGFSIVSTLGKGGMATVYLAKQISLGRDVALKLMSPQISTNPEAAERFLREARIAATVNHPNVVSIIDVGHADGQLYMALELVTGGDAAQLAERFGGVLPEARALELLIDCVKGLQALYEARLVHRDLKPSNILITKDGTAKLGDLGLARSEDGADRLTATGHLIGTPAFMSPEQAGGEGTVDIRSDIYALGATLFALVTGRQPFIGNSPIAVAAKALTEPAPDPRSLMPSLSAATATLILRTMAKAQHQRFQTPQDLREALQQALAHAPHADAMPAVKISGTTRPNLPTTPVTIVGAKRAPTRTPRMRRTQPPWVLISFGLVIVGIVVVVLMTKENRRSPDQTTEAKRAQTTSPLTTPVAPAIPPVVTVASQTPSAATSVPPVHKPTDPIAQATLTNTISATPPLGLDPPQVRWAASQGKDEFGHWITIAVNGVNQRLRWLPPGTCTVGAPPGEAGRTEVETESQVTFTFGSWLADTECTQALWQAVTGKNPSQLRGDNLPVNFLSVEDAITFTHALRPRIGGAIARLPSRAEWERACRAGATTTYATGADSKSLAGFANLKDRDREIAKSQTAAFDFTDGFVDLAPVASLRPNHWGFYDLHGNVSEYCLGMWAPLPPTCRDPLTNDDPGPQIGFIRGGAFDSQDARCAAMHYIGKGANHSDIGFRFLIEGQHAAP